MTSWKAMPVFPKILIVCLVLGVVYKVGRHRNDDGGHAWVTPPPAPVEEGGTPATDAGSQVLGRYESQLSQLMARVNQCVAEANAAVPAQAAAAANGMIVGGPACIQYMPQWTVQAALLTTYITRLKTGNPNVTVCEANAGLRGCESLEASAASVPPSDDGTGAVERATRQGIRGSTIYTDANGDQHELPARDYYYRDRNTGQFVGSDSPNPPDNVHDYEPLQPER